MRDGLPFLTERRSTRLRTALYAIGLPVTFGAAVALGIVLHLGTAPARRITARLLSDVLTSQLRGRFVVKKIDDVDLWGIDGADLVVDDQAGHRVLEAHGLRARASILPILVDVLRGAGAIDVVVARARIDRVVAMIEQSGDGTPTLFEAFMPRPRSASSMAAGPVVRVWLPDAAIQSGRVQGRVSPLPALDVDLAGVSGSVLAGSARSEVRVKRFSINVRGPRSETARGTAETIVQIPSLMGENLGVWGTFDGYVGDVQVAMRAGLDGNKLKITADLPRADATAVRALVPALPIYDPISLHLDASGTLPNIRATGRATVGDGTFDYRGDVSLSGNGTAQLVLDGKGVDLRSFVPNLPQSKLDASATVTVAGGPDDSFTGTLSLRSSPFEVQGTPVPPATVNAQFSASGASGSVVFEGGPNLQSKADVAIVAGEGEKTAAIDVDWMARVPDMAKSPWLSVAGRGAASVHAKGRIEEGKLDARVEATVDGFSRGEVSLDHASFSGTFGGPVDDLVVRGALSGRGLAAGPARFSSVEARVAGPIHRVEWSTSLGGEGAVKVDVAGRLEPSVKGVVLSDLGLRASKGDVTVTGKARSLRLETDGVAIDGIVIDEAGAPIRGSLRFAPGITTVRAQAERVDLERLVSTFIPHKKLSGHVSFDVDAKLGSGGESGHFSARVEDGSVLGLSGVSGRAEATLDGRRFSGNAKIEAGAIGSLEVVAADAELAGDFLALRSWTRATGKVEAQAEVSLEKAKEQLEWLRASFDNVAGIVHGKIGLSRDQAEAGKGVTPTVDVQAWTEGLKVTAMAGQWRSEGLGLLVRAHLDGSTQLAQATAGIVDDADKEHPFCALTVIGDLSKSELFSKPERFRTTLPGLPLTASLALSRRAINSFPEALRPPLDGDLEAVATMTGTWRAPQFAMHARGYGIRLAGGAFDLPLDADLGATYDASLAVARLKLRPKNGGLLDLTSEIRAPLSALFEGGADLAKAWEASGTAQLSDFPLASLPFSADRQIEGQATGTLAFSGLNRTPQGRGEIKLEGVRVQGAQFPRGRVQLSIEKGKASLMASLDQAQGGLSARGNASVDWGTSIVPRIDPAKTMDASVIARDLRGSALLPVLEGVFTYFDGRIDGGFNLRQEPTESGIARTVDGALTVREGAFQIPEVGQMFHDARVNVVARGDGRVQITDVSAGGTTGRLTGSGNLVLRGFDFESGTGQIAVAKKEALPLTLEGVSFGNAWGTLDLSAKRADERTIQVDIKIPQFRTEMPESSGRNVQDLDDNPKIKVGRIVQDDKLVPILLGEPKETRSADALGWHIVFNLGREVSVRRGSQMDISVSGSPVVDLTDRARLSGSVDFTGGWVEVLGKRFEVEHGAASFDGDDPSDPVLAVTSSWEAPDGTRIHVDFVGPLKSASPSFWAEPARSQTDIMAILLSGSAEQATGSTAAGIAGGVATADVNKVLSSVVPLDVTTRVDTSAAQNPSPEVAVQLSPKVMAEISYRTKTPLPGEKTDRVMLTIDWRFLPAWSIATTLGDQGSSVMDLLWRYRY
jgi:translocation and assembly module TamB